MFGHFPELIVILVLALIFFGPEKLPEIAGSAGKMVAELRAAMDAAMHPDTEVPEDEFATYYYDSMERSDGTDVELEELPDPADDDDYVYSAADRFDEYGETDDLEAEHGITFSIDSPEDAHPIGLDSAEVAEPVHRLDRPESA